jgi:hypothetical protein
MQPIQLNDSEALRSLPLTLPRELWVKLSPAEQAVYRRAEALLDSFTLERSIPLSRLLQQGPRAEVLRALQVLGTMELVEVAPEDEGPTVTLRAVPDEHVRVTGPDGQERWLFVARPLEAPEIEPSLLN